MKKYLNMLIKEMRQGAASTEQELIDLGFPKKLTYRQVAVIFECSFPTVYRSNLPRCKGQKGSQLIKRSVVALALWDARNPAALAIPSIA